MQFKTTDSNRQQHLNLNGNKRLNSLLGYDWGARPVTPKTPPWGGRTQDDPLLYLNDYNGDKKQKLDEGKHDWNQGKKPTSACAKKCYSLTQNLKSFVKKYGIENLGFLTLTFKGNLSDEIEAQRRYKNLNRTWNREKPFKVLCRVLEYQDRGAIHYHCVVLMPTDIRTGFDWESFDKAGEAQRNGKYYERQKWTRQYSASSAKTLRETWSWLRNKCESHGFGRSELLPIKKPDNIGSYLGKYLVKENRKQQARHNHEKHGISVDIQKRKTRAITYGQNISRVANTNFSWVSNPNQGTPMRVKIGRWAEYRGFKSTEEIRAVYGPHWSHHLRNEFMHDRIRKERQAEGLPPIAKERNHFVLSEEKFKKHFESWMEPYEKSRRYLTLQDERKRLKAFQYRKNHSYHY